MAGKSTYLRQVALIAIMAQMGSFVPATEAVLGLIDRVLTRIGARDDLRRGESTFMVEMRETARLLDGLGRSGACCCSTRSDAAPALSTDWRSRGRWLSICTTARAPRCCSRRIFMN